MRPAHRRRIAAATLLGLALAAATATARPLIDPPLYPDGAPAPPAPAADEGFDWASVGGRKSNRGKSTAHAAQVGGTVRRFSFVEGSNTSRQILNFAGVVIEASCEGNDLGVTVDASGTGLLQSASTDTTDKDEDAFNETLKPLGPTVDLLPARDKSQLGHTEITRESGPQVSIHWVAANQVGLDDCVFSGNAVSGP